MKKNIMRYLLLPLVFCFIAFHAQGKTWRVERDGSGDFDVIQDCVEVSDSGDTILVGSGRYDEWQMYGGNTQYPARLIIEDKDLTIIGESDGSSVIGPEEPWEVGQPEQHGVVLISGNSVTVSNLSFENLFGGVMSWADGDFSIKECLFFENNYAVYFQGGNGVIESCDFSFSVNISHQVFSNYQNSFFISSCTIQQVDNFSFPTHGIDISGCPDTRIEGCLISGMRTGLQFDFGTTAIVANCQIWGISRSSVFVGLGGCSVNLTNCLISNSQIGFNSIQAGSMLIVESTILSDIGLATLLCNNLDDGFFRDCTLAKGERGVVLYQPHLKSEGVGANVVNEFDMRGNFWSTDNPDSIQTWIEDNSDDPDINYRILWEPYNGEPVPSKPSALGSVKSLFR